MDAVVEIKLNSHLKKKCSNADIGYKAVISAHSEPDKKYFGIAEITFKDQLRNYTRDFRHKKYVNTTIW